MVIRMSSRVVEGKMTPRVFSGLWRDREFVKLWAGQSISVFGSQITILALPLAASEMLRAGPSQMGLLGLAQFSPWLVVGLLAGAWVDRLRRRPIMMAADLGRAALLALIPLAAVLGLLRMELLYGLGFLVGILNVFFEVAYTAYLPSLIAPDRLVEGNSKLQSSASLAEVAGPGLAGLLVEWISAPLAIIGDAVSFLISALSLGAIHAPETEPQPQDEKRSLVRDVREGLTFAFQHPMLRALAAASMTGNFAVDMYLAVYLLYVTREIGVEPALLGLMYSLASVGGLLGAVVARPVGRQLGIGRTLILTHLSAALCVLLIPFTGRVLWRAVSLIVAAQFVWAMVSVIHIVNAVSVRQATTPNHLQGRVMSSIRFLTWGISPPGFVVGGWLGEWAGLQTVLIAAGMVFVAGNLWLWFSPLPGLRDLSRFA
jgi:MFS family permease